MLVFISLWQSDYFNLVRLICRGLSFNIKTSRYKVSTLPCQPVFQASSVELCQLFVKYLLWAFFGLKWLDFLNCNSLAEAVGPQPLVQSVTRWGRDTMRVYIGPCLTKMRWWDRRDGGEKVNTAVGGTEEQKS